MSHVLHTMLTDEAFLGAFLCALALILLGFGLRRRGAIDAAGKKAVSVILLRLAVPCMAFNAFMTDLDVEGLGGNLWVLAIDLLQYALLMAVLTPLLRRRFGPDAGLCALFAALGQITLFSMPILKAIYADDPHDVMLACNMMTLPFRLMLYLVGYSLAAGVRPRGGQLGGALRRSLLNPVMLAMLAGLLIWATQGLQPQLATPDGPAPLLRLDRTLPAVYAVSQTTERCVTPLAMLLVGLSLGESRLGGALRDKAAWLLAALRALAAPLLVLGLLLAAQQLGGARFNPGQIMALLVGTAAPTSATLTVFCVQFHRQEQLVSRVCFLSTLLCAVSLPLCYMTGLLLCG